MFRFEVHDVSVPTSSWSGHCFLASLVALAIGCGGARLDVRAPDPTLSPGDLAGPARGIEGDVRLAAALLHHAYAGRRLATDETWLAALDELGAVPERAREPRDACDALGDALARLGQPGLFVTDSAGQRCGRAVATGSTPSAGANVAAGSGAAFVLDQRASADGTIAILAIRTFDSAATWDGFEDALVRFAGSELRILDLRGAGGDDTARAAAVIEALAAPVPRVEPIAPGDPAWLEALGVEPARDPRWSISPRPARGEPRTTRVLIDGACAGACELVAEALSAAKDVATVGSPTAGTWMLRDPATVELPWSHARLVVPTGSVEVEPGPAMPGRVRPTTASVDALATAWFELERDQSGRARMARFAGTSPTCADARPVARLGDLPADASARVDAWLDVQIREGGSASVRGSALLSLDPARVRALMESCPGAAVDSIIELATGETIAWLSAPAATWLLLTQLPSVVHLEGDKPLHPTAASTR